jgi:hypothetical protein
MINSGASHMTIATLRYRIVPPTRRAKTNPSKPSLDFSRGYSLDISPDYSPYYSLNHSPENSPDYSARRNTTFSPAE